VRGGGWIGCYSGHGSVRLGSADGPSFATPENPKRSDLFPGRIYGQTAQVSTDGAEWLYNHDLEPREKHDSFGGSKSRPRTGAILISHIGASPAERLR
jgi:hypothetical protein